MKTPPLLRFATYVRFGVLGVLGALAVACGSNEDSSAGSGGTSGTAGAPPFEHPEPPTDYVPQEGSCGFDQARHGPHEQRPRGLAGAGDNTLELLMANTWTGTYRTAVTGADLVFDNAP